MGLTRLAIRRPVTMVMALVSILVLGGISFQRLPLAFLPNAEFPFIGVQIPFPNGVPTQVEREIARPVEEVLATLGGVQQIFSHSDSDGCFVGVRFEWGRRVDVLRVEVKEKLDQIRGDLPSDVRDIFLMTFDTNQIPIIEGRISARDVDLSKSYDLIERRVIHRLQRVAGVGQVEVHGVEPADVSVYLRLNQLKEYDVDVGRLFERLGNDNLNLTAGQIEQDGLRWDVRVLGSMASAEELSRMPVGDGGLRLDDVADVVYSEPALSYGRYLNLEPCIAFTVQKASGANTVEVVEAVKAELDRINQDPALSGVDVVMFFDQGEQITNSLEGLLQAGLMGALLAVGVLYFFLRNMRTTLIVALSIPLSIVGTASFMYLTGRSLNILSMMGLMLGVGMLIDNAVVVLESIYRRMGLGESPQQASEKGTQEVWRAVVAATLTSVVVFAPIVFGGGNEMVGWLREVGVTLTVTLVLSLVVSLTVIPLATHRLLRGSSAGVGSNRILEWAGGVYSRLLEWTSVRHPWVTGIGIAGLVIAATVGAIVATGFQPEDGDRGMRQEYLSVNYDFSDNMSYRKTHEYVVKIDSLLMNLPAEYGIDYVYSYYQDNFAYNRVYFEKSALSEDDIKSFRQRLREDLPEFAGVKLRFGDDQGGGSGVKGFSVTVHGEDTDELARIAQEAKRRLTMIEGITDVATDIERGAEEIQVHVDPDLAHRYGTTPQQVSQIMGITFRGVQLPRLRGPDREIDLWVVLQPEDRRSIENIEALAVGGTEGREVTLAQVAKTVVDRGANRISRQNQRTAVGVRGSYEGEEFNEALEAVTAAMNSLRYPAGYGWNMGDDIVEQRKTKNQMGINALLAVICVYMIMASLFESLHHPGVVMFCLPFASLGVVWIMILTNTPFNIMAMIGMVILIGIVVNNGIVLVDHINNHRREGASVDEAILGGGRERFRPILMTATTTILGLIPLAVGRNHIGGAETFPMARAIIGGLASSTVLTLIMLPTYYQLSHRMQQWPRRSWGWVRSWSKRRTGADAPAPGALGPEAS